MLICYNLGCIGHARYATAEEASAAKSTLNGADLCGSSIVVDSWEKGRQDGAAGCSRSAVPFDPGCTFAIFCHSLPLLVLWSWVVLAG